MVWPQRALVVTIVLILGSCLGSTDAAKPDSTPAPAPSGAGQPQSRDDPRHNWPDSFKYYGPNGLWKTWTDSQKIGRDTWIFWTGGNQKFLRLGTSLAGGLPVPMSVEYYRLLDSRLRDTRFTRLGLINEPNCRRASKPDQYGLWLDEWDGDPEKYYPDTITYGEPSGIVGFRKFKNPEFDPDKWDVEAYFKAPSKVEPPYLFGFSCALCHIAFDPIKPPKDPEHPRWENLAANIGNQYLREGDLFFTEGRIFLGDQNPGTNFRHDPYDTQGVGPKSFLYHYAHTQQPGTSETSRLSYDFINNPNTINSIFYLGNRVLFPETDHEGNPVLTPHVLKDGADSVGLPRALLRVWVNIGMESYYWTDHLWSPVTGHRQHPFQIAEIRLQASEERKRELKAKYGEDFGQDWAATEKRVLNLVDYLASYTPYRLADAPSGAKYLTRDADQLKRGAILFADNCARCHSNKHPIFATKGDEELKAFYRASVLADDFRTNNTLTDDRRYKVTELGLNMARALATNAVDGDIWSEFSSKEYKALEPIGTVRLTVPVNPRKPITLDFTPPGGGRGYYRTASLVSMWATAPYFHNNALGEFVTLEDGTPDTSVEGRMKAFNDAVEKLLWPERRPGTIKRTTADSGAEASIPAVRQLLVGVLKEELTKDLENRLGSSLAKLLEGKVPGQLKEQLADLVRAELTRLDDLLGITTLPIPKGTPVNLFANLNTTTFKYAAIAFVKYRKDPDRLVEELLKLSDCPDLVEDHGHEYGKDLKDSEKRDLIEFLKTL